MADEPSIKSVEIGFRSPTTTAPVLPSIKSVEIWFKNIEPAPILPSIKSIEFSFDRPAYKILNFPWIMSIEFAFDKPLYSPAGQQWSNPVFMFTWF